jgi:2-polyprenyl-3-methyl-5-hydroxy-6-metoxy-1,4-benzoquinol methylase
MISKSLGVERTSMTSIYDRKAETYVEDPRLISWILADPCNPLNCIAGAINGGRVLDIGCGTGILGRLLAGKTAVQIDGVDPAVAEDSSGVQCYRRFFKGRVEQLIEEQGIDQYDWFVMADVIEHFAYPDEMLAHIVSRARLGARFVVSTPNVAHLSIRLGLLDGRFDYVSSGILESTHLRFFTLKNFLLLLEASGLFAEKILLLNRVPPPLELAPSGLVKTALALAAIGNDELALAYQFLAFAEKGGGGQTRLEHVGERLVSKCYSDLARLAITRAKQFFTRWN